MARVRSKQDGGQDVRGQSRGRRGFEDKAALSASGSAVSALTYERASSDGRKQTES
jgi:hypothetical protein